MSFSPRSRRIILTRDPRCRCPGCPACTIHGCDRPSTIADHDPSHAELVRAGLDTDDPEHGKGMCDPCHDLRTAAQAKAGRNRWKLEPETPNLAKLRASTRRGGG